MRYPKIIAAMMALASTGCVTYSLQELRQATPTGSPFQKALTKEYLAFASSEEKQYDWIDAIYFGNKGLLSAYGKDTQPENLADWDIPQSKRAELESARARLVRALSSGATQSQPQEAARAQVYFDCWVEQQEENWQVDDIAHCRDGLNAALDALGSGSPMAADEEPEMPATAAKKEELMAQKSAEEELEPEVMAEIPASIPAEPVKLQALPVEDTYIVFFEKDSTAITPSGEKVIGRVLQSLQARTAYDIVLNSHTDTVGDAKDNLKLTEERAQAVKQRLVDGGAHESDIKIFAFGESDPPAPTRDNVDEPANRRVEIVLSE